MNKTIANGIMLDALKRIANSSPRLSRKGTQASPLVPYEDAESLIRTAQTALDKLKDKGDRHGSSCA